VYSWIFFQRYFDGLRKMFSQQRKQLLLLVVLFFAPYSLLFSQHVSHIVVRGDRPPIDLNTITSDSYKPGIIHLKLDERFGIQLEETPAGRLEDGTVRFFIEAIDVLNNRHGVRGAEQLFRHPSLGNDFSDRHKAWGFHLWYRLEFDDDIDVIDLVRKYEALDDVVIAEPEYRKRLISDPGLRHDEIVDAVKENQRWTPNDPHFGQQWHYHNTGQQSGTPGADIDLLDAWNIEKGHPAVVVAIIDDGIQFNHPDLAANMWQNASGHYGYNFVDNTSTISPGNHGTHVAGTVAAVTNNATGVAGVAGGSGSGDGVRLMSCQVFTSSSSGGFHLAPVWAADNGVAISQNSWGYVDPGVYNQNVLDAIDYFNAHGGGDVMDGGITIFAAGNDNDSGNWYPGYYSGAFSVAATNNQDNKAWYSNYGSWIDISAPGGETNSVSARGVYSTLTSSSYGFYQGTSMACPHVSGVAALLLSRAYRQDFILENDDLWDLLVDNVDDHYAQNPGFPNQLGSGRLNANLALMALEGMLSGLINPSDFTAVAISTSQIDLEWTKNPDDHDVMLIYTPDGNFGTPADGTVYGLGNTIPGGGVVLFRGSATSFNHTGLEPATMYYYRAFSYNESNEYSSGRSTHAVTFCDLFDTLPFAEDFDASTSLPYCWEIVDHQGNGQVWQFGTHPDGLIGTTGNYAYLDSDDYGSGNSQNADLIMPVLDLSAYTGVTLSFTHYFRQYQNASTARLSYSIDGGATWTEIENWTSTTANPVYYDQEIVAVAGQPAVRFKWNYTGTWGWSWNVDDIVIDGILAGTTHTVSLDVNPPEGGSAAGAGVYAEGATVSINAIPETGYFFVNWTGDTSYLDGPASSAINSFVMPGNDVNLFANFSLNSYEITAVPNNSAFGAVDGGGTYNHGDEVTLTATPYAGYEFVEWTEGGVPVLASLSNNNQLTPATQTRMK